MITNFAMFATNPVQCYVKGTGEYVRNFLCNLEKNFEEAEYDHEESIRQDYEHDND